MYSVTRKSIVAVGIAFAVSGAWAGDSAEKTAIGSGLGGAAGAVLGNAVGGSAGAVVGGAAGGAVGAAATTKGPGRTGAIVGGAVGGGAGAAVGQQVGGTSGAIVGAGLGGAAGGAIGREVGGGGKPQSVKSSQTTVVRTQTLVVEDGDCGGKRKKHPGKGWAKGHNKGC
jgi:hypothetical protein